MHTLSRKRGFRKVAALAGVAAIATLAMTGCVNNESGTTSSPTATAAVTVDEAAAALLPAEVRDSGTLVIGTNLTYAPDEFKKPDGQPTGWGIELVTAMSQRLGLEPDLRDSQFDNIIPGIKGGKYDVGWASFTDNLERQKSVDFVDYYNAGIQWASRTDNPVDPDNACGLTIAVGTGTYQETDELPAKSKACEEAGKPPLKLLKLDTQGDITNAVVLGRADAMSADSPVTQYAVSQTDGKLALAGDIFDAAPFGMAVAKDSELTKALQAAMQSMIDDGTYMAILQQWGVEAGAVETATINGGTS
ncbi:MAG TPA: ABC transporter substrate-binding protein [Actinomycetota bacterium]|nr:ABC transporter substrate-binding protein [Actinomycetota bacterium]